MSIIQCLTCNDLAEIVIDLSTPLKNPSCVPCPDCNTPELVPLEQWEGDECMHDDRENGHCIDCGHVKSGE